MNDERKPEITFMIGGIEVDPSFRQRVGIALINLGGWILKGSRPSKIEMRRE